MTWTCFPGMSHALVARRRNSRESMHPCASGNVGKGVSNVKFNLAVHKINNTVLRIHVAIELYD